MPADVIKIGPLGPYANNSYVIADRDTKKAIFVDAPIQSQKAVDAAKPYTVERIVITHRHGDHWAEIDRVMDVLHGPVNCHDADRAPYAAKVSGTLADGDEITIGNTKVRVLHTPGHTPGSICLLVPAGDGPDVLISGDTLFPGGPGRSDSPAALQEMIRSITARLLTLPDDVMVYPGHGDNTSIGDAKREYAVFASKEHAADLCGDVTWEGS
jgi:glyoxylase-like metal-dependent hydrolase (beta-lactamase superfamily II)